MLKKVTISRVFKNTHNKDGIINTYKKGKDVGKNFIRVSIKTEELGEDMYSTCAPIGDRATNLEIGNVVLLKFTESNGFKNFNFPTQGEQSAYEQALADAAK